MCRVYLQCNQVIAPNPDKGQITIGCGQKTYIAPSLIDQVTMEDMSTKDLDPDKWLTDYQADGTLDVDEMIAGKDFWDLEAEVTGEGHLKNERALAQETWEKRREMLGVDNYKAIVHREKSGGSRCSTRALNGSPIVDGESPNQKADEAYERRQLHIREVEASHLLIELDTILKHHSDPDGFFISSKPKPEHWTHTVNKELEAAYKAIRKHKGEVARLKEELKGGLDAQALANQNAHMRGHLDKISREFDKLNIDHQECSKLLVGSQREVKSLDRALKTASEQCEDLRERYKLELEKSAGLQLQVHELEKRAAVGEAKLETLVAFNVVTEDRPTKKAKVSPETERHVLHPPGHGSATAHMARNDMTPVPYMGDYHGHLYSQS